MRFVAGSLLGRNNARNVREKRTPKWLRALGALAGALEGQGPRKLRFASARSAADCSAAAQTFQVWGTPPIAARYSPFRPDPRGRGRSYEFGTRGRRGREIYRISLLFRRPRGPSSCMPQGLRKTPARAGSNRPCSAICGLRSNGIQ